MSSSTKRINRLTYIVGMLLLFVYTVGIFYVSFHFFPKDSELITHIPLHNMPFAKNTGIVLLFLLPAVLRLLTLTARRMNDIGLSDRREVPYPFYSLYLIIDFLTCIGVKGKMKKNKYGEPPKPGIDWNTLFRSF